MMFGRGYNGFNSCFGSGFMFGGWGMIMMGAVIVLVVAALVFLVKRHRDHGYRQSGSDALEALKLRFAKGEISEEEYLRRRNILD